MKQEAQLLMKALAIHNVMIQLRLVTVFTKDAVMLSKEYERATNKIKEINSKPNCSPLSQ